MRNLFLSLLSGLALSFSWPELGVLFILFFAFVPLLILEDEIQKSDDSKKGIQVFWFSFLSFFIFNAITTYWIYHATLFGAIAAFLVNATLMATAFFLFHKVKSATSDRLGYLAFVVFWISMEYLHLNWGLSWPWLILGNGFANFPDVVQWFEFTGFLGGSLWLLLMNILVFKLTRKQNFKSILLPLLLLIIPITISYYVIPETKEDDPLKVLIVQPNVDPYVDKFSIGYEQQLTDFIELAKPYLTQETQLLIGPETALLEGIWENRIENSYSIKVFNDLQKNFPNLNILVGASTYKMFGDTDQKTATARQLTKESVFYDAYNSAIFISNIGNIDVYHKTKLVPGVEKMPFPYILDPLAKLIVDLGGTSGSLGSENTVHQFNIDNKIINPLICYESIYGDLKKERTNFIAIITNDGWWKNTIGYKQHFAYASLRAIEQRKTIIRSANTGISGIINSRGEVLQRTNWDEKVCIVAEVYSNKKTTFYSLFGDYIGRLSLFMAAILFVVTFVKVRLKH